MSVACQRSLENEGPPIPMLLRCPACNLQHVDAEHGAWYKQGALEHLCVGCSHRWRPSETHATFGLCCTGIGAAWCPIHGDCNCPNRAYALDGPSCPLHRDGSDHGAVSEERDVIGEMAATLRRSILRAVDLRVIKGLVRGHGPDGSEVLVFDPGVSWNDVVAQAVMRGVIMTDEAAFLRRVAEVQGWSS